jgi:hypothetical protein
MICRTRFLGSCFLSSLSFGRGQHGVNRLGQGFQRIRLDLQERSQSRGRREVRRFHRRIVRMRQINVGLDGALLRFDIRPEHGRPQNAIGFGGILRVEKAAQGDLPDGLPVQFGFAQGRQHAFRQMGIIVRHGLFAFAGFPHRQAAPGGDSIQGEIPGQGVFRSHGDHAQQGNGKVVFARNGQSVGAGRQLGEPVCALLGSDLDRDLLPARVVQGDAGGRDAFAGGGGLQGRAIDQAAMQGFRGAVARQSRDREREKQRKGTGYHAHAANPSARRCAFKVRRIGAGRLGKVRGNPGKPKRVFAP